VTDGMSRKRGSAGYPRNMGAQLLWDGVVFNLWAPTAETVELIEEGKAPQLLRRDTDGWYQHKSPSAKAGTLYQYRIDRHLIVPDPASCFQPYDVGGPSEVIDREHLRDNDLYPGRPWPEAVIYELHVGTFTPEGTYAAAENKLPYLHDLGITAIELMPLNDVPGRRNWGYDGVLLNAPNARYGRPADLKRFLHAAHDLNMMVYLDVVYNHFGPHLNYLHSYAEPFFNKRHQTGWGPAVNLEGADDAFVRRFLIDNAMMWVRDYGFNGLRLDAVHALKDDSEQHFLVELAQTLRQRLKGRDVHLMLENEANQARYLERSGMSTPLYNAQWGDDFHNALHVLLTGEQEGYYRAFADKPLEHLARTLVEGFAFQGETFALHNRPRGEASAHLPPEAIIFFAQNHDQVGNRAFGERLTKLVPIDKLKQTMALVLLSPHIPMIFMGEEAAADTPFLFFCDWTGALAEGTREGRRKEFAHFSAFATPELRDKIPDPCDEQTFLASKIDWSPLEHAPVSRAFRDLTKELLAIRHQTIIPMIKDGFVSAKAVLLGKRDSKQGIHVRWQTRLGDELHMVINFSNESLAMPAIEGSETVWPRREEAGTLISPWQIAVRRKLQPGG
jgi:maltooligosyltrehalose trehalohydrolase